MCIVMPVQGRTFQTISSMGGGSSRRHQRPWIEADAPPGSPPTDAGFPPGVAASYRRGESLSRGFSIVKTEAPLRRGQRGSDGGSLQGADVTASEVAIGEAHP